MRATDIWNAVLGDLELQVPKPIYETWLRDTEGLSLTQSLLTVGVPTPFAREWLERRMYQVIQKTASKVNDRDVEVEFQVGSTTPLDRGLQPDDADQQQPNGRALPSGTSHINDKYTFSSFVVGPSNRLSYSAAQAVAEAPGQSYNPLFMYSGVGLGKTHLLHAIGHTCSSRGISFIYVTSEQFTNEFIASIRSRTTDEFRARYRTVDVLLIDDIQFISGKEQTQEGFFHTFNDLHTSNRQVVLTSDRPPKSMARLEDRLRSRFGWGLIADIQPPDLETRMAILRTKAERMHVTIDASIIEYVGRAVQKNVRELEGSLNRIVALARVMNQPITVDLASQAIIDFMPDSSRRCLEPDNIVDQVCRRFKVSADALAGVSRKKQIVRARHVAMYLLHEELGMKYKDIGRMLGSRDHSTVTNGIGRVNHQISMDAHLQKDITAIRDAISI